MVLLLEPKVRRVVQKLVRKLYEKAEKLPAEVAFRSPRILILSEPVCLGGYADVYQGVDVKGVPSVALKKMRILKSADPEKARRVRLVHSFLSCQLWS